MNLIHKQTPNRHHSGKLLAGTRFVRNSQLPLRKVGQIYLMMAISLSSEKLGSGLILFSARGWWIGSKC